MSIRPDKVHHKLFTYERGKLNRRIIDCPYCEHNFQHNVKEILSNCIGVCHTSFGTMAIIQCPKCFEYWKFHLGNINYKKLVEVIKQDLNIHFSSSIFDNEG